MVIANSIAMAASEAAISKNPISGLPDDVLYHAFSFLDLLDIVATTFLSRRWRNLWTCCPVLSFGQCLPQRVNRALALYSAPVISKFSLCLPCDMFSPHVGSWIRFAVKHDVRALDLDLSSHARPAKVHPSLYSCESLEELRLGFFRLNLPPSVRLRSLRTLELYQVEVGGRDFEVLSSGCPKLDDVCLQECNRRSDLKIYMPDSNIRSLRVQECNTEGFDPEYGDTEFELSVPKLLFFTIGGEFRKSCTVKSAPALISANFDFEWNNTYNHADKVEKLRGLLRGVSHVKSLRLSNWCIQVLCRWETEGGKTLRLSATQLELKMRCNWDVVALSYLLNSSMHLESLVLDIDDDSEDIFRIAPFDKLESIVEKLLEDNSSSSQHLKTIKINNFMGCGHILDRLYNISTDKLMQERRGDIEIARFLLKKCRALRKMILLVTRTFEGPESKSDLMIKLPRILQCLPRASSDAEVLVI